MRIRLDSIGCRLNSSEIESLARTFAAAGHRIVGPGDATDLVVFNSCAVTHTAAATSRRIVRQFRRRHAKAAVVVTGCYATLEPAALEADLIVRNAEKDRLPDLLAENGLLRDADPVPDPLRDTRRGEAETAPEGGLDAGRVRAFVKVQDGCDNRCTFCIVTVARGAGRSRAIADVVDEINSLTQRGYQEAVLSGVHLGSFGRDLGIPHGLSQLVRTILNETDLPRLRLSSLEPWDLDESFFDLWQDARLLPHLHLPLQSGCDATLRRMARRTNQKDFAALLTAARAVIPDVAISTDVIVGFPGESDSEFEESIAFVAALEFSRLHIFRYSRREGTAAASMPDQVPAALLQARSRRMHALGADCEHRFQQRFIGTRQRVLWESSEPFGFGLRWSGLTGNYLRVVMETPPDVDLRNRIVETELVETAPGAVVGRPAPAALRYALQHIRAG